MKSPLEVIVFMLDHLNPENFPAAIRCTLLNLDLPDDLDGYKCLFHAIGIYYSDPDQSFTKELYIDVGKCFTQRIDGARVEKLIRYTIGKAWNRRDPEVWDRYFPHGRKPTNGEFIARITEILYLWQACCEAKAGEP